MLTTRHELRSKFAVGGFMLLFILLIIGLIFVLRFLSKLKVPKVGSMCLVTGGIKTGKTNLSVYMAIKDHKKRLRSVKFKNYINRIMGRDLIEEPLLYSNIPLNYPHVRLTEDLLLRNTRFRYGSVIYVCEASLVIDSTMVRNLDLNERVLMFNKLISHETRGGSIYYDTQAICDIHFGIRRNLSNYIYIHHLTKWIPFVCIAHVRELMYSDDQSTINVFNKDVEDATDKLVLIPKWVWKKYDRYCYSVLTDHLDVDDRVVNPLDLNNLKADAIVSFKKNKKYMEVPNNEKENNE
jgi:hypothetical protein